MIYYNPNPVGARVGDCTVRAISKALGQTWQRTYVGLCLQGFEMGDMPSANSVWGAYLRKHGYRRNIISNECSDCYTVNNFCKDHPKGTYILAISGHVVCVADGAFFDTWDSGQQIPVYYWTKEEKDG